MPGPGEYLPDGTEGITGVEDLPKAGKEIVAEVMEVIQETVASGRPDGAMSLIFRPERATLVAGRYVADGAKLEDAFEKLLEAARQEDPHLMDEVLKKDVEEYKNIRLRTLLIPVPKNVDNRDKVVQLVGNTLEVVVGTGKQSGAFDQSNVFRHWVGRVGTSVRR